MQKKAYCFDFDETLVTTNAKIYIYKRGVYKGKMNSKEFNFYEPKPDETLDFTDFKNGELILTAKKYKMWPVIENINKAVKEDRSNSDIYILTARSPIVKSYIYEFLKNQGISIDIEHIITIGDDKGDINISNEKRKWLNRIVKKYDVITYFDDDPKNIAMAGSIKGIRTRLVENIGGVSAPMATAMNTPGMGNATPAGPGVTGSGDNFGNTVGGKPYAQGKIRKKKRKKKKLVKEIMNEKFVEKSDPITDMGIGVKGLWDYTPEEAAEEIWRMAKPTIQRLISQANRSGITYRIIPERITKNFANDLAFEPDDYTFKYITNLIKDKISQSLKDNTLTLNNNVKVYGLSEGNINPYDKIARIMTKRMRVKPPFKKKKSKNNQNAMVQQKFEHEIITFNQFTKLLNENK